VAEPGDGRSSRSVRQERVRRHSGDPGIVSWQATPALVACGTSLCRLPGDQLTSSKAPDLGITGEKPVELSDVPSSEKPATMREATKCHLLPTRDEHAAVRFDRTEISEARLYPPLAEPPGQQDAAQLEILRRRVREYWVDGALKHSLHSEVLISLGKREDDKAVDAPWKYTVEVSDAANSAPLEDRDVSAIYDATGLLLILGEPGSGKTTTMLDLTRTLLDRARDDIRERVPIVLNLSSWKKGQPLTEWIGSELSEKYHWPVKLARSWLQNDYLVPLLDGLDDRRAVARTDDRDRRALLVRTDRTDGWTKSRWFCRA
jgi:hypothetical protein